jgi:hypothetical protein
MNWYELRRSDRNLLLVLFRFPQSIEGKDKSIGQNSMGPCLDMNRVPMSTSLARYRYTTSLSDKLHVLANEIRQWFYMGWLGKPIQFRDTPYSVAQL